MQVMKIYGKKIRIRSVSYAEKFDSDVEFCGLLCYIKDKRKTAKNG